MQIDKTFLKNQLDVIANIQIENNQKNTIQPPPQQLLEIKETSPLSPLPSIPLKALSVVDQCIDLLVEEGFWDKNLVIQHPKLHSLQLDELDFKPLENFMSQPISLCCMKLPVKGKNGKTGTEISNLKLSITVKEIFSLFGDNKDIFSLIGSGAFYFLPKKILEGFLEGTKVGKNKVSLKNCLPQEMLEKFYREVSTKPDDLDFSIDLSSSYLTIDAELKKISDLLVDKMKNQEKEGLVTKTWAQDVLKKHSTESFDINDELFWEKFIERVAFTKKNASLFDHPLQYAMVRFVGMKGEKIEFILKKKMPRTSIYTSSSLQLSLARREVFLDKCENQFDYSFEQCFVDKVFKRLRPMQQSWKLIYKGKTEYDPKDWEIFISQKTKGYIYRGNKKAELEKFQAVKHCDTDKIVALLQDAVENHQGAREEAYLPLLINAYSSLCTLEGATSWEKIVMEVLEKTKDKKLSPQLSAIRTMLEKKIPFPIVSAYLQVVGFLDLCLVDKKHSCFEAVSHDDKIHLQISVNENKDILLLPFEIDSAMQTFSENIQLIEAYNFLDLFVAYKLFNVKACRFSNIKEMFPFLQANIDNLSHQLLKSPHKFIKDLGVVLHHLPWNHNVHERNKEALVLLAAEESTLAHPSIFYDLAQSPHALEEEQIQGLEKIIRSKGKGVKWRDWILQLSSIPYFVEITYLSLEALLKRPDLLKEFKVNKAFIDPFIKKWMSSEHSEKVYNLFNNVEVENKYSPMEKLKLFLEIFSLSTEKDPFLICLSKKILLECSKSSIQKNAKDLGEGELKILKKISLNLILKGEIDEASWVSEIFFSIDFCNEMFNDMIKISTTEILPHIICWWRKKEKSFGTYFVDVTLELLNLLKDRKEDIFTIAFQEGVQKVKTCSLSEQQKQRFSPFITEELNQQLLHIEKRNLGLEIQIDRSFLQLLEKFDFLVKLLGKYADLQDKTAFVDLFEFLSTTFKECKTSETFVEITLKQLDLCTHKQKIKILKNPILLSHKHSLNQILTMVENCDITILQREEFLAAILTHQHRLYPHVKRWAAVIEESLKKTQEPSKTLVNLLRNHLDVLVEHFLNEKKILQAVDLLIYMDRHGISFKIKIDHLKSLQEVLLVEKQEILERIPHFLSVIREQALKENSAKKGFISLNVSLANRYLDKGELNLAEKVVDRLLEIDPKLLSRPQDLLIQRWSSILQQRKHCPLRDRWFTKTQEEILWLPQIIQYCDDIDDHELRLEKIKNLCRFKNEKTYLKLIERTLTDYCSYSPSLQYKWSLWLESQSLFDLCSGTLIMGLTSSSQEFFLHTCKLLQQQKKMLIDFKRQDPDLFSSQAFIKNFHQYAEDKCQEFLVLEILLPSQHFRISSQEVIDFFLGYQQKICLMKSKSCKKILSDILEKFIKQQDPVIAHLFQLLILPHIQSESAFPAEIFKSLDYFLDDEEKPTSTLNLENLRQASVDTIYRYIVEALRKDSSCEGLMIEQLDVYYDYTWVKQETYHNVEALQLSQFLGNTYAANIQVFYFSNEVVSLRKFDVQFWISKMYYHFNFLPVIFDDAETSYLLKYTKNFYETLFYFMGESKNSSDLLRFNGFFSDELKDLCSHRGLQKACEIELQSPYFKVINYLKLLKEDFPIEIFVKENSQKDLYIICQGLIQFQEKESLFHSIDLYAKALEENIFLDETVDLTLFKEILTNVRNYTMYGLPYLKDEFGAFSIFSLWGAIENCVSHFDCYKGKKSSLSNILADVSLIRNLIEVVIGLTKVVKEDLKMVSFNHLIFCYKLYEICASFLKRKQHIIVDDTFLIFSAERMKVILFNFLHIYRMYWMKISKEQREEEFNIFIKNNKNPSWISQLTSKEFWEIIIQNLFEEKLYAKEITPSPPIENCEEEKELCFSLVVRAIHFDFIDYLSSLEVLLDHKEFDKNYVINILYNRVLSLRGIYNELRSHVSHQSLQRLTQLKNNNEVEVEEIPSNEIESNDRIFWGLAEAFLQKVRNANIITTEEECQQWREKK